MSTPGGDGRRREGTAADIRAPRLHDEPAGNTTLENVMCDLFSYVNSSAVRLAEYEGQTSLSLEYVFLKAN